MPLIALAGQPNVGKSTLFNLFTGFNQHVGNWPGKTVERREGKFTVDDHQYSLVDLPGTYSLTANSPEEVIAREFILRDQPDVVVAVVNASNLERSLYLVAELVTFRPGDRSPEHDGCGRAGRVLHRAAGPGGRPGCPGLPMTATRTTGTPDLMHAIEILSTDSARSRRACPRSARSSRALEEILHHIDGCVPAPYPAEWVALKLLEGDAEIARTMQNTLPAEKWEAVDLVLRQHDDALLAVASGRYEWIGRMVRAAVVQPRMGQISWTKQLDHWAAHPLWGLVILAGISGLVFWLTFTIGSPVQAGSIPRSSAAISPGRSVLADAPFWIRGLVVDGILGGVGAVLTFLPIMVIFFAVFGLLEDMGYMARAAYVMDNMMHLMGLHGKSFLPLFLGFGCNVPAIMGTRVIDSKPARLLTTLIAPLVPCTARMAVVAFLAPGFFWTKAILVSWGLVLFSMLILVLSGSILNKLIFNGQRSAFIMEMPLYHLPNCAHHWPACLAAVAIVCPEGRHEHSGDGCGDLGAFSAARRKLSNQLPGAVWKIRRTRGPLDGLRLAFTVALITSFPPRKMPSQPWVCSSEIPQARVSCRLSLPPYSPPRAFPSWL